MHQGIYSWLVKIATTVQLNPLVGSLTSGGLKEEAGYKRGGAWAENGQQETE